MVIKNSDRPKQDRAPVYIPFKTFLTAIETLEPGLPPALDRSVWPTFSGGLQSQTLGAFKYLELIKEDGTVQPILQRLINAKGDERKVVLREIIQEKYAGAIQLAEKNASFQQLEDYFRASHELQPGTLYRIIRYFLDACAYTGEKCSIHWAKAKKSSRRSAKKEESSLKDKGVPRTIVEQPKPDVQTVQLQNEAGTVSLSLSVNLTRLTREDWDWLHELIDKVTTYGQPKEEKA